jgi:hypothetical protein
VQTPGTRADRRFKHDTLAQLAPSSLATLRVPKLADLPGQELAPHISNPSNTDNEDIETVGVRVDDASDCSSRD